MKNYTIRVRVHGWVEVEATPDITEALDRREMALEDDDEEWSEDEAELIEEYIKEELDKMGYGNLTVDEWFDE